MRTNELIGVWKDMFEVYIATFDSFQSFQSVSVALEDF